MKKTAAVLLAITMTLIFCACAPYAQGGRTRAVRKELNALFEGENYYIKDSSDYMGEISVSEYTKVGELKYYGLTYGDEDVKFMKTGSEYAIIDEVAKTATVYSLENAERMAKEEGVFDGEKKFLEALFTVTLDNGTYIGTVENEDKSAVESYTDANNGTTWKFYFTPDGVLEKTENVKDNVIVATYEIEYSTEGNINLFKNYDDYERIEK